MSWYGDLARGVAGVGTMGLSEAGYAGYKAIKGALNPTHVAGPDAGNYSYGRQGGTAQQANDASAAYARQGQGYNAQGNNLLAGGQHYDQMGQTAQGRQGPQISGDTWDRARQLAALGGISGNAAQLNAMGAAPMGDSVAAAQLQQGQQANAAQQLSAARSGRTLGGSAANLNQAMFNNAVTGQQTNQAAAAARLQEQQQYHQFQLGALGAAQQGFGAAGQQANNINGSDLGVQQANAGYQLQQGGLNNQLTGLYGQMGGQQQGLGIQSQNLGLQYAQLGNKVNEDQLSADAGFQTATSGIAGTNAAADAAGNQAIINGATGLAGAAVAKSDVRAKTKIADLEGQLKALGGGTAAPQPVAPDTASLDDAYRREGGEPNAPAVDLRPARGYSYEYRDPSGPGAAPGRQYGPMAQDLEQTSAGASVVRTMPGGGKGVDTGRLALVNTAALSEQQRKTKRIEDQLATLGAGPRYAPPSPYPPAQGGY